MLLYQEIGPLSIWRCMFCPAKRVLFRVVMQIITYGVAPASRFKIVRLFYNISLARGVKLVV